jgi:TRAP-type C4-dicarboxylate transport system substrate-binding protein
LLKKFPAKGMVALAWGDQGFRHLTNSKRAVRTPADAKGLKIRTMENPVHILAFNTLGMQATPMAWPEVIPGLQQGVVDGAELPVSPMAILKWWEFQKHVTLDGHVFSPMLFIMATKPHSALSAQDKEAFAAAAKSAGAAQRKFVDDREKENLALLKSHGIQVVEQIDKAQWRAVLKPAYDSYAKKYGQANIDRIINFKK